MIKEFKNSVSKASAQNFYGWVIKQTTEKKRGPIMATSQNIGAASGAPAAPLPTPMITGIDQSTSTFFRDSINRKIIRLNPTSSLTKES